MFSAPIWTMAFRPMYLFAAIYGIISILLWGFGFNGTTALPNYFWHANEMIWGYAGAIIVGFLHTATPNWTGLPAKNGKFLILLTALWLVSRITVFFSQTTVISGICGVLFFWIAAFAMLQMLMAKKSKHNYIAAFALFIFGLLHLIFHLFVYWQKYDLLLNGLLAGLILVSGFIGFIGSRVIPFFTARRLNIPQVKNHPKLILAALLLPLCAALLIVFQAALPVSGVLCCAAGGLGLVQVVRWLNKAIFAEPMLWILFAGYTLTAIGLICLGFYFMSFPIAVSVGVHFIAVGGIGGLTVGMMTRTAAGHTGRAIYPAPKGLPVAFVLMILATLVRVGAVFVDTAYQHFIALSAVLFALSLAIFVFRYAPWLTQPRADSKMGIISGSLKTLN